MKILTRYFAILTLISAGLLSIAAQTRNEVFIVGNQKTPDGCLQIKRLSEESYTAFCGQIRNFNYLPGYFYILKVRAANGTGENYSLRKIVLREKSAEISEPSNPKAADGEWMLIKIRGENVSAAKATLFIDEKKKAIGGFGGCNRFGGNMTKTATTIKFSQVFSTKMYCETGSDVENKYLSTLENATKYKITGNKLILSSDSAELLEFTKK